MSDLEGAARAIAKSLEVDPESWRDHVDQVRAVLVAIRDPSEAMCEAGAKYYHDNYRPGHAKEDTSMQPIWEDMIDALLRS